MQSELARDPHPASDVHVLDRLRADGGDTGFFNPKASLRSVVSWIWSWRDVLDTQTSEDRTPQKVGGTTMKMHTLGLAICGVIGAAGIAHAQNAAAPADPLSDLQAVFGTVVGDAFHAHDQVVEAATPPGSAGRELGGALRTSLEVPGAVFAGVVKPFADADAGAPPAPAPAPVHHRHVHIHHHVHAQG